MGDYISREDAKSKKVYSAERHELVVPVSEIDWIPPADVVARDCYGRILAENDNMRKMLAGIGKKPGDKMDDVRPVVHEPDDRERICLRAINHFGVEHQKWKLVEELGELLVEIAREHIGRGNKDAIREELADANIMCRQMRIVYGAVNVDGWIRRKLQRLVDRMNEEGPDGK